VTAPNLPSRESEEGKAGFPQWPWEGRTSIYTFLRGRLAGQRVAEDVDVLPDEPADAGERPRFGAGVMDGIATHHMGTGNEAVKVDALYAQVAAFCGSPTAENKKSVYETVLTGRVVGLLDPLLKRMGRSEDARRVYELGHFLAVEAADREPVKLGIALLGVFAQPADREVFFTLGSHDEFSLFAAVALSRFPTAEADMWQLARSVHGWGRVHTVERLAKTQNEAIKAWLLREGFRNKVMNEYLAMICARGGELAKALADSKIDEALFEGAGEILEALINGGPAPGIESYEEAPTAVGNYLAHAERMASTIHHHSALAKVKRYLRGMENPAGPWTVAVRDAELSKAERILGRPEWRRIVEQGLVSNDDREFFLAARAAEGFGIDTWDYHWRRLLAHPLAHAQWHHLAEQCDASRMDALLEVAHEYLPLGKLATGPTNAIGLGPGFEVHRCVDFLLTALRRFPGRGAEYALAALRSPGVRNRNMAAAVLKEWGRSKWPPGTEEALLAAIEAEPKDDVRGELERLIGG